MITMNGHESEFLRKYSGEAELIFSFCNLEECMFDLYCYKNGSLRVVCNTIASNNFFDVLKHDTDKNKVTPLQASLHGRTHDGDEITITELFLDNTTFSSKDNTITIDPSNLNIESSDPSPKGVLTFIPLSEIHIVHSNVNDDRLVTIRFGIFNFEFTGTEKSNPYDPRLDQIIVFVGNLQLRLVHDIDYDNTIGNLHKFDKVAITSECEINTNYKNVDTAKETLQNCCWILSFATSMTT